MSYFTKDFNNFFKGLAANNNKVWFHENKKTYEKEVKNAFAKFLADLIVAIQEKYDPDLFLEVKNAVFRINRDIRFSKDKTPYKLQVSAVISRGGRKNMQLPGMYLQFGVGEIWIGGGMYSPDKENLRHIRKHIEETPGELQKILEEKKFKNYYKKILGDQNKRIPQEFKSAHEHEPLIANKQFYFMASYDNENILLREDLLEWVLGHYEAGMAINSYMMDAVAIKEI
jgi:uncharacterized protein (TIGR02453 family)